tara:strand:- start:2125 stop:3318 length:1194 start_codon:yes stop_codon:yes gene_type:complete
VPLAGKYRLVDIPISNCINAGYNQIYLLTQFNTASLHRHIQGSFHFDPFGKGFVEILAAEQTEASETWYQGTADAVRRNLRHFHYSDNDLFLILSGDQLYSMDFRKVIEQHRRLKADVTVAAKTVACSEISAYGAMKVGDDLSIQEFVEKPQDKAQVKGLKLSPKLHAQLNGSSKKDYCLASMGIYVFTVGALKKALSHEGSDFGKEIIPALLEDMKLHAYIFDGYWEDIGTVRAFFDANLMLTDPVPEFNFFDAYNKIYTRPRYLPGAKLNSCHIDRGVVADGAIITQAKLKRCVIGTRSVVSNGSILENVVMMGASEFETLDDLAENKRKGIPNLGIGEDCIIKDSIIDKDARIGNNVVLSPGGKPDKFERNGICVRDGVLCVLKDAIIPDGTVI